MRNETQRIQNLRRTDFQNEKKHCKRGMNDRAIFHMKKWTFQYGNQWWKQINTGPPVR